MFSACLCDHVVQVGRSVREHRKDKDGKISWNFLFIDKTAVFVLAQLSGVNMHLKCRAVLRKEHMQAQQRLPM